MANDRTVLVGSNFGTVWLLDAATGAVRWRHLTGGRLSALAHGGDTVYISWFHPMPVRKPLGDPPERPRGAIIGHPAQVLALRVHDGSVLWRRDGWNTSGGRTRIALDGDVLVSDGPSPTLDERILYGLDAHTGEVRWSFDIGPPWGLSERLMGARAGRVFVYEEEDSHRLDILDAQTGAMCWRASHAALFVTLSQGGRLVVVTQPAPDAQHVSTIYNAADGSPLGTVPRSDVLLGLTDEGTAYVARDRPAREEVAAVRMSDGTDLWSTTGVGGHPMHVILRTGVLYCARFAYPRKRAEVRALDPRTGAQRWRWRSPGWLPSLLALWGRRLPQVLLFVAAQARRSIIRARDRRDRSIFYREVIHGQWRHPTQLVSQVTVAADSHAVYVGTSLDLIALRASDGRRLWYALPMMDFGWFLAPAVAP